MSVNPTYDTFQREQEIGTPEHFDKLSASQEKLMFKNIRLK
jgi:hypothetical protein